MRVKTKLEKLEQRAKQHYEALHLPNGTVVNYKSDDAIAALSAAIDREEHWLIPLFCWVDTTTGLPGLIKALAVS